MINISGTLRINTAHSRNCHDVCVVVTYFYYTECCKDWLDCVTLTSSILLAEVGEPPDVAQSHTEAEHGEEELDWAVPGDPGLARLGVHTDSGGCCEDSRSRLLSISRPQLRLQTAAC